MKVAKIFSVVIVGVGLISASAIATARTVSLKFSRVSIFTIPNGADGSSDPRGIAVDGAGNIYVTDGINNQVDKFNNNGQIVSMFGGPSNPADPLSGLSNPNGIAVTSSGSVYVTDTDNNRLNLYRNGKLVSSYGNKPNQKLKAPTGVNIDRATGKIYVTSNPFDGSSDRSNVVVLKNQSDSLTLSSTFPIPNPTSGNPSNPAGIAVARSGYIYVTDKSNNRVIKFDKNGHSPTSFGHSGTDNQGFGDSSPNGIDADQSDVLYVADTGNDRLSGYEDDGEYLNDYGNNANSSLNQPQAATVGSTGKVYIISQPLPCNTDNGCSNNSRIVVLQPTTTTK